MKHERERLRNLAIIYISLWIFILSFGNTPSWANKKPVKIETIAKKISVCPDWSEVKKDDTKANAEILNCLQAISRYKTDEIRIAIVSLTRETQTDLPTACRIFLLNRYLFKVSKSKLEGEIFGGWAGVPIDKGEIDWLWPFRQTKAGDIELINEFEGYFGSQYQAVKEFDYFRKKFGRRLRRN